MKKKHLHDHEEVVDPVLSQQGGRMMPSDPGHVIPTSEEDIRRRAHAKYEQRGRGDGKALDDWIQAEAELRRELKEDWRLDQSGPSNLDQ